MYYSEMKVSQSGREQEACTLVKDGSLCQGVVVDRTWRPKVKRVAAKANSGKKTSSHLSLKTCMYSRRPPLSKILILFR